MTNTSKTKQADISLSVKRERIPRTRADLPPELPYSEDTSVLGTPLYIGNVKIQNRIVYQPMEGCDGTSEGAPGELTRRRYLRFARGGAGLIWFEATAVVNEGRANPHQLFIHDGNVGEFASLVAEIKSVCLKENGFEPVIICQLTHSGRYSKPYNTPAPLIAYNNPIFEKDAPIDPSRILSDDALDGVRDALIHGAKLANAAGFDGVDIKACHRYLLCELLSAYTRPGRYGGSFEGRTRLLTEAVAGALSVCGEDFIVTSRFNAYDGFEYPYGFGVTEGGGIEPDMTEAIRLSRILGDMGVKMLNVTMGNPYFNSEVNRPTAFYKTNAPFESVIRMQNGTAELTRAVPNVAFVCSALSFLGKTTPNVAAGGINAGMYALAGIGRLTLAYPDFAKTIIGNGELPENGLCITCGKCTAIMRGGKAPGCAVRDELYKNGGIAL